MTDEANRKEEFLRNKEACITHMENHRIYFQPGDKYEKVLFHHCNLHCPEFSGDSIHFKGCVFWGCRYFSGEKEVSNLLEAMGDIKYVEISDEDKKRVINAEGFRMLLPDEERRKLIISLRKYQGYDRELRKLVHNAADELERLAQSNAEPVAHDWHGSTFGR